MSGVPIAEKDIGTFSDRARNSALCGGMLLKARAHSSMLALSSFSSRG
jgi:hypothetical protein